MTSEAAKVRRTVHFKFTLPNADPATLLTMVKASAPFLEAFGATEVRLMQNVDNPGRFLQTIEYDTHEAVETNRQRIASDPMIQAYLQTWRSMFAGAVDVDVYQDVAGG